MLDGLRRPSTRLLRILTLGFLALLAVQWARLAGGKDPLQELEEALNDAVKQAAARAAAAKAPVEPNAPAPAAPAPAPAALPTGAPPAAGPPPAAGAAAVPAAVAAPDAGAKSAESSNKRSKSRQGQGAAPSTLPETYRPIETSGIFGMAPKKENPFALLGIAGRYAILAVPSGQIDLVPEGGELGGVKLLKIDTNRVLVEHQGKQLELTIFSGFGSTSLLPPQKEKNP